MPQRSLFPDDDLDPPAPRQRHSRTSCDAADAIEEITGRLRRRVLVYLTQQGERGATDEEMQEALAMNPSTQRPRRIELEKGRLVVDSGRKRRTTSGRAAVVWMVISELRKTEVTM